jgi:DnaK suppressor protein
MEGNLELIRQTLESQLKGTGLTKGMRESIRIHQLADPVDMTQQAAERELAVQTLDRDSSLARRLRSAIERVDAGSYGVCLHCEEEIAPKRLRALPWAELCIDCQEESDRDARHNRSTYSDRLATLPRAA